MALQDWDGTTSYDINKIEDYDGTTTYSIAKVCDKDDTTEHIIWTSETIAFNGEGCYIDCNIGSWNGDRWQRQNFLTWGPNGQNPNRQTGCVEDSNGNVWEKVCKTATLDGEQFTCRTNNGTVGYNGGQINIATECLEMGSYSKIRLNLSRMQDEGTAQELWYKFLPQGTYSFDGNPRFRGEGWNWIGIPDGRQWIDIPTNGLTGRYNLCLLHYFGGNDLPGAGINLYQMILE